MGDIGLVGLFIFLILLVSALVYMQTGSEVTA